MSLKNKYPPIFLKLWCSSHGKPWHGLPEALSKSMHDVGRFSEPIFDSVSGREINDEVVALIRTDMSSRSGRQVHIIIMGGNNIRSKGHPTFIIPHFRSILEHSDSIKGCFVLVVGLLPSPKTDNFSKSQFISANTLLKKLTFRFLLTSSFLNVAKHFVKEVNEGKKGSKEPNPIFFKKDGIHLSYDGSLKLAKLLQVALISIPNSKFE